eukprot:1735787-Rhodomonas_salina.1
MQYAALQLPSSAQIPRSLDCSCQPLFVLRMNNNSTIPLPLGHKWWDWFQVGVQLASGLLRRGGKPPL